MAMVMGTTAGEELYSVVQPTRVDSISNEYGEV